MAPIKSCAALLIGCLLAGGAASAQSVVPNGADTAVTTIDGTHQITGGTLSQDGENLFHSFEQFGLSAAETANFVTQPNVLNVVGRINGGSPSVINGQLGLTGSTANLFLLNPVGVIFGPDATLALPGDLNVSTADGLMFTDDTLDVVGTPDYASLVGRPTGLVFRLSSPGAVINTADLSLGDDSALTLAGGSVVSTGTVSAGEVAIASVPGQQLIHLGQDGAILGYDIAPDNGFDGLNALSPLTLPELLTGAGTETEASAPGTIANSLQLEADGTVRLVNADLAVPNTPGTTLVNGTITAGEITLLGDTVGVANSVLDASAPDGGGTIHIGGSYQGQGPLPNAQLTYVSADSVVDASATNNGNGGEIIVWSDQTTRALGQFAVRGGPNGGNGGLIETSGLSGLTLGDSPDISAPLGTAGEWLIDPFDVRIVGGEVFEGFDPANPFVAISSPALVSAFIIENALTNGGTVRVTTGDGGNEAGNISLETNLNFFNSEAATLSLEAAGSILINGAIGPGTLTGPVNLNLLADTDNTGNGQVVFNNQIDTAGGNLTVTANSTNLTGVADTSAIILAADNVITTENGNFNLPGSNIDGSVSLTGVASDGSGIHLNSGSLITADGALTLIGQSDNNTGVLIESLVASDNGLFTITGNSGGETGVV
ncbi:MAG: filamentous hemagglutinin N-terminal domain-containing protein, partial [Cyanobacteria bacterium J06626_26]